MNQPEPISDGKITKVKYEYDNGVKIIILDAQVMYEKDIDWSNLHFMIHGIYSEGNNIFYIRMDYLPINPNRHEVTEVLYDIIYGTKSILREKKIFNILS